MSVSRFEGSRGLAEFAGRDRIGAWQSLLKIVRLGSFYLTGIQIRFNLVNWNVAAPTVTQRLF